MGKLSKTPYFNVETNHFFYLILNFFLKNSCHRTHSISSHFNFSLKKNCFTHRINQTYD